MAVAGYEYRIDGGSPVDMGMTNPVTVSGLTASTSYDFEFRAYDDAGNRSAWTSVVSELTDAPPFNPADIANIIAWYDAGQTSGVDGVDLTSFTDLIGSADMAPPATAPVFRANSGDPYLEFRTQDQLVSSALPSHTSRTIVTVYEHLTSGFGTGIVLASGGVIALMNAGSQVTDFAAGGSVSITAPWTPPALVASLFERVGTACTIRGNGTSNTNASMGGSVGATTAFQLSNVAGQNNDMNFREAIVCSGALSGGDFTGLAAYISTKYGLTL